MLIIPGLGRLRKKIASGVGASLCYSETCLKKINNKNPSSKSIHPQSANCTLEESSLNKDSWGGLEEKNQEDNFLARGNHRHENQTEGAKHLTCSLSLGGGRHIGHCVPRPAEDVPPTMTLTLRPTREYGGLCGEESPRDL